MNWPPDIGIDPYYSDDRVVIFNADCRDVLPELKDESIDTVVTDPPYKSLDVDVSHGTTTRLVGRKAGKRLSHDSWFGTLSTEEMVPVWEQCRRALVDPGSLYIFCDPKSGLEILPALKPANVIVWDKCHIGMGYAWRRQHEWIGYIRKGKHRLRSDCFGDVIQFPSVDQKVHPTEKPTVVLERLIENSVDVGGVVLDPFAGSCATAIAAKNVGRRCICIELEERYCEIGAQRCRQGVLW